MKLKLHHLVSSEEDQRRSHLYSREAPRRLACAPGCPKILPFLHNCILAPTWSSIFWFPPESTKLWWLLWAQMLYCSEQDNYENRILWGDGWKGAFGLRLPLPAVLVKRHTKRNFPISCPAPACSLTLARSLANRFGMSRGHHRLPMGNVGQGRSPSERPLSTAANFSTFFYPASPSLSAFSALFVGTILDPHPPRCGRGRTRT